MDEETLGKLYDVLPKDGKAFMQVDEEYRRRHDPTLSRTGVSGRVYSPSEIEERSGISNLELSYALDRAQEDPDFIDPETGLDVIDLLDEINRREVRAEREAAKRIILDYFQLTEGVEQIKTAQNENAANSDDSTPKDGGEQEELYCTPISERQSLTNAVNRVNADMNGEMQHFNGHLFDEGVFNDSVREFLRKRAELADYFDESKTEDIFDYIPPQKTNQIFTPKRIVKMMVDKLEEENPGCFDDPNKTFADLYMKSGLYIRGRETALSQRRTESSLPQ